MRVTSFGSYDFTANGVVVAETDPPAEVSSGLVNIPFAAGAFDGFGSLFSPRKPAKVTVRFYLPGPDPSIGLSLTVDEQVDLALKSLMSGRQWLVAVMNDGSVRQTWAKCIGVNHPRIYGSVHLLPVTASFELPEPWWYAQLQTTSNFAISTSPGYFYPVNGGTSPLRKLVLRYIGAAQTPQFNNWTNGMSVKLNRTMTAGQVWELNTAAHTMTLNGVDCFADIVLPANQIELFRLELGQNSCGLTAIGSPSGTATLIYRTMYE